MLTDQERIAVQCDALKQELRSLHANRILQQAKVTDAATSVNNKALDADFQRTAETAQNMLIVQDRQIETREALLADLDAQLSMAAT